MSIKELKSFLKKENEKIKEVTEEIDWGKQKNEWLDHVNFFYSSVQLWLNPLIDEGAVNITFEEINLIEDYIGSYTLKKMIIKLAGKEVVLIPIGSLLIGTKGRIDMEGSAGKVQFLLADKDSSGIKVTVKINSINGEKESKDPEGKKKEIEWTWKMVRRGANRIQFDDFNEDNFSSALMEVMGG
ncbi:hypothetical protein SC171_14735 [Pantoea cypripedii]|uniref:hypothetical protein n=1 Tax=Pantoea cypripedii TaxID=55209 RepID=UPI002FC76777